MEVAGSDSAVPKWKYLSLTSVEYPTNDRFGKILALVSNLPLFITSALLGLMIYGRKKYKCQLLFLLIGIFFNDFLSNILKNWIQQPRPSPPGRDIRSYGMPSAHSQFVSFFSVSLGMLFVKRERKRLVHHVEFYLALFLIFIVGYSRVYLLYHTWGQVFLGWFIGAANAVGWVIAYRCICDRAKLFPGLNNNTNLS